MEVSRFEDIQAEFMQRIQQAVYCSVATIDRMHRPRSRVMHLIWEGAVGWVITRPQSLKTKHIALHPAVSITYLQDAYKPVYVDCSAAWVDADAEKIRIWELHKTIPPPLGFDPQPYYGTMEHPDFGILRFTPWRVELGNLYGQPLVWRPGPYGSSAIP